MRSGFQTIDSTNDRSTLTVSHRPTTASRIRLFRVYRVASKYGVDGDVVHCHPMGLMDRRLGVRGLVQMHNPLQHSALRKLDCCYVVVVHRMMNRNVHHLDHLPQCCVRRQLLRDLHVYCSARQWQDHVSCGRASLLCVLSYAQSAIAPWMLLLHTSLAVY